MDYLNSFFIFFLQFYWDTIDIKRYTIWGFPGGSDSKESACNAGDPAIAKGSGEGRQSTEDFQGSETILHKTVMVDTWHLQKLHLSKFSKQYNINSEPYYKLWTLVNNNVSILVH